MLYPEIPDSASMEDDHWRLIWEDEVTVGGLRVGVDGGVVSDEEVIGPIYALLTAIWS